MEHFVLNRREYVHGTRDYSMEITNDDLKIINEHLERNGFSFAPITFDDVRAIWNNDETARDNQKLEKYGITVSEVVSEFLQDWIYDCDYKEDYDYDCNAENWTEEY